MTTVRKCGFCGREIASGTGKMLIDHSGAVSFYCSSKCEKCVELRRSARKIKWTQSYRKEKDIRVQHLKESQNKKVEKPEAKEVKAETRKGKADESKAKTKDSKHKTQN